LGWEVASIGILVRGTEGSLCSTQLCPFGKIEEAACNVKYLAVVERDGREWMRYAKPVVCNAWPREELRVTIASGLAGEEHESGERSMMGSRSIRGEVSAILSTFRPIFL